MWEPVSDCTWKKAATANKKLTACRQLLRIIVKTARYHHAVFYGVSVRIRPAAGDGGVINAAKAVPTVYEVRYVIAPDTSDTQTVRKNENAGVPSYSPAFNRNVNAVFKRFVVKTDSAQKCLTAFSVIVF